MEEGLGPCAVAAFFFAAEAVAVSLHIEKQSFHKGYISMITI